MNHRVLICLGVALTWSQAGCGGEEWSADDDTVLADDDDTVVADDDATGDDDTTGGDDDDTADCEDHCANGLRDCGETGVDCGGACDPCPVEVLGPEGSFPTVAATADKVVVAWCHEGVQYACKDDLGWTAVHSLDVGTTYTKSTRLQADGQGRIHLVVTQGGGNDILYAVMGAEAACAQSSWSAPEGLAGPEGGRYPNVAVDVLDEPHVIWHDQDYTQVFHRRATAGQWSDPIEQVTTSQWDSRYPDITVAGTDPHVIYEQDDASYANCLPNHTYRTGGAFTAPFQLADTYHSWPQIAADSAGDVHALYTDRFGDCEVKYRRLSGGAWGGEHVISTGSSDWTWSSLAADGDLGLHAAWHQLVGGIGQVVYAVGDAATGTWEPPRQVSSDAALDEWQPAVSVAPDGAAHVVWMRVQPGQESGEILYRVVVFEDL